MQITTNFAVITNVIIKRVHCISKQLPPAPTASTVGSCPTLAGGPSIESFPAPSPDLTTPLKDEEENAIYSMEHCICGETKDTSTPTLRGALVAQWVKRWLTDLSDRVRSPFEAKYSQL